MNIPKVFKPIDCSACKDGKASGIEFTMAFQPIVDLKNKSIFGYEALVRGLNNESAFSILSQVNNENRYVFDQSCRVRAIQLASELNLDGMLSINFLPGAVYNPKACINATLQACTEFGFPTERLMFEVTESEEIVDNHLKNIFIEYKRQGFMTAFDDFGAGFSNMNLLASFQPDLIKLDMALIRDIHSQPVKEIIVAAIISICHQLSIKILAEGVETKEELNCLAKMGINIFQGYYFAKPGFKSLPEVTFT